MELRDPWDFWIQKQVNSTKRAKGKINGNEMYTEREVQKMGRKLIYEIWRASYILLRRHHPCGRLTTRKIYKNCE